MLSSHLSRGLPLGLFPFILNFITTLSVDSSSLLMTCASYLRIISRAPLHVDTFTIDVVQRPPLELSPTFMWGGV